jgi:hypothetical protein
MPIVPVVTGEWAVSTTTDGADLGNYAAYFRNFTGGFVGIMARLYSNQKEQISTSIQLGFFSANSHPKVDREWPNWNLGSSEVQLYRNGVFLSERDREKFNTYIARISTIAGSNPEHEDGGILADDGDSDADRISSDLVEEAKEVTARPMDFDAEFCETGGIGMQKDVMDDVLLVDKPHVARLVGTLRWTTQQLEYPEIHIAEIAALANVGVRGLARYTIERIVTEGRIICDAIYACQTTLAENKAQLTELCHQLAEQEKKAKWFREHQDKIHLSYTELEEKKREIDDSLNKLGAHDSKVSGLGERVGSPPSKGDWMDQIVPAGLRQGTSVGWSRKQSVAHRRGADAAPKEPATPSPRPLREIMGAGSPRIEEPVTGPTEHLPDDDDNTPPESQ